MRPAMLTVAAVVVTRDRLPTLRRSVASLTGQDRPPDLLVVVDNGADDDVREFLAGVPGSTYIPSRRNLGGAGGFALGILHALALGADWVWLADDDGLPTSPTALARLLRTAQERDLGLVSPAVVTLEDPTRLAFPLRRGARWVSDLGDVGADFVPGFAALFNGALVRAETFEAIGVPDLRLFIRGDEVEMHRRLVRSGTPFGTDPTVTYAHPSGQEEWHPIARGLTRVLLPPEGPKRYFTFRNRGYLTSQPGMRRYLAFDVVRYTWYFLLEQRDPAAFFRWWRTRRQGARERFDRL